MNIINNDKICEICCENYTKVRRIKITCSCDAKICKKCIHYSNNTRYSQILIITQTLKALDLLLKQSLLGIVSPGFKDFI